MNLSIQAIFSRPVFDRRICGEGFNMYDRGTYALLRSRDTKEAAIEFTMLPSDSCAMLYIGTGQYSYFLSHGRVAA
jgi:hypothetical protein